MWRYDRFSFVLLLILQLTRLHAQDCQLTFEGVVTDLSTGRPIEDAFVQVKEGQHADISDEEGHFRISGLCPGEYHISISHMGCETQTLFITMVQDTSIGIPLDHFRRQLHEVAVHGQKLYPTTQVSKTLHAQDLNLNAEKNLATLLDDIPGVTTLRNGSNIAKPVIQGLYGNRVSILNNGVPQGGQQWGVDHSPEIDPLLANKVTVVKGVSAVQYQGSNLGGLLLVNPDRISEEPHVHGQLRYYFNTNGRTHGTNASIQQYTPIVAWKATGTYKRGGDLSTSHYYLRNTGYQEINGAIQLEKKWNDKLFSDLYLSTFNTRLGVLRGSHIGNLTDLQEAFHRDIPFYTQDAFSYAIDAPYQNVNHHLVKVHTRYDFREDQKLDFTYATQLDLRREYDVRRSSRSEKPALSLSQQTQYIQLQYLRTMRTDWQIQTGLQMYRVKNKNLPETGILPLIPDYNSYKYGGYIMATRSMTNSRLELGTRYDYESRHVAAISTTLPRELLRYHPQYHAWSAILGYRRALTVDWDISASLGYAMRNPEVNELYANGLHQGVSGIELGDPELLPENSLKSSLSVSGDIRDRLTIEAELFYQYITDYIYLQPQDELQLTIRGAFPVFAYEQTDAQLWGTDLAATLRLSDHLTLYQSFSYLRGQDLSYDQPLVYMPTNRLRTQFSYQLPSIGAFENINIQLDGRYVLRQYHLLDTQDFLPAPDGYFLLGAHASAERQFEHLRLQITLKCTNLLNTAYRDYLNRQRYFADDLGRSLILGINLSI